MLPNPQERPTNHPRPHHLPIVEAPVAVEIFEGMNSDFPALIKLSHEGMRDTQPELLRVLGGFIMSASKDISVRRLMSETMALTFEALSTQARRNQTQSKQS